MISDQTHRRERTGGVIGTSRRRGEANMENFLGVRMFYFFIGEVVTWCVCVKIGVCAFLYMLYLSKNFFGKMGQ